MPLDLSEDEKRSLAELLKRTIQADHYPAVAARRRPAGDPRPDPPPVRESLLSPKT
jgi:hypothetical protein